MLIIQLFLQWQYMRALVLLSARQLLKKLLLVRSGVAIHGSASYLVNYSAEVVSRCKVSHVDDWLQPEILVAALRLVAQLGVFEADVIRPAKFSNCNL